MVSIHTWSKNIFHCSLFFFLFIWSHLIYLSFDLKAAKFMSLKSNRRRISSKLKRMETPLMNWEKNANRPQGCEEIELNIITSDSHLDPATPYKCSEELSKKRRSSDENNNHPLWVRILKGFFKIFSLCLLMYLNVWSLEMLSAGFRLVGSTFLGMAFQLSLVACGREAALFHRCITPQPHLSNNLKDSQIAWKIY